MGNKRTVVKLTVLLSIFLVFIMFGGLQNGVGEPVVSFGEATSDVDWTANEILVNDGEYHYNPTGLNFINKFEVKENSALFILGVLNVSHPASPIPLISVDGKSYINAVAAVNTIGRINVTDNSTICTLGSVATNDTDGVITVQGGSNIYASGAVTAAEVTLSGNSYIYVNRNQIQNLKIGKVNGLPYDKEVGHPNIIIKENVDYEELVNPEKLNSPCPARPPAELKAKKIAGTANEGLVIPGEEFEYTITLSNKRKHSSPIENVIISDVLPAETEFAKYAGDNVVKVKIKVGDQTTWIELDPVGNDIEINLATQLSSPIVIAHGKDVAVSFMVTVNSEISDEIKNVATITNPLDPDNPLRPEVIVYPKADLGAEKGISADKVSVGEEFEYTITVSNTQKGSNPLSSVTVVDRLPEGIEFVDGVIKILDKDNVEIRTEIISESARNFKVTLDELAHNKETKITFTARATETGTLTNVATVTGPDNTLYPEVSVDVFLKGVLEADKQVSAETVMVGEEFEYTIIVKNSKEGSDPLIDVRVEDELPNGIEFVGTTINVNNEEIPIIGNSFEVIFPEVDFGNEMKISFMAVATEVGAFKNIATVTDPGDPDNPKRPEVTVEVLTGSIKITKVDSEDNALLKGAKFELYQCVEEKGNIEDCESIGSHTTDINGEINADGLTQGYYRLVETKAPEGYALLTKPIDIGLIDKDNLNSDIEVKNYKTGWNLPTTGGIGTYWYYSFGSLLMISALLVVFRKRRLKY